MNFELLPALVLGLMSSLHCIGMCGPLALALPVHSMSPAKRMASVLGYHAGRISVYSTLGLLSGLLGWGIYLAGYQQILSVVLGLALIVGFLFSMAGSRFSFVSHPAGFFRKSFGSLWKKRSPIALLFSGMLNGLLPCGMVYIALAAAVSAGSAARGALFMATFGLGTLPALFLVYILASGFPQIRIRFQRVTPIVGIVVGCLLVIRGMGLGIPYLSPQVSGQKVENCCAAPVDSLSSDAVAACH